MSGTGEEDPARRRQNDQDRRLGDAVWVFADLAEASASLGPRGVGIIGAGTFQILMGILAAARSSDDERLPVVPPAHFEPTDDPEEALRLGDSTFLAFRAEEGVEYYRRAASLASLTGDLLRQVEAVGRLLLMRSHFRQREEALASARRLAELANQVEDRAAAVASSAGASYLWLSVGEPRTAVEAAGPLLALALSPETDQSRGSTADLYLVLLAVLVRAATPQLQDAFWNRVEETRALGLAHEPGSLPSRIAFVRDQASKVARAARADWSIADRPD